MSDPYAWLDKALQTLHRADWYRRPQAIAGLPGPVVAIDGRSLLNFASNDYLGLAGHPALIAAATEAIAHEGTGSTGSRLITGHRDRHRQLEQAIAALKQTEDAVVFSSGYLANLGTIAALVGPRDGIFSDRDNHASLLSGIKLSGATAYSYHRHDLAELRDLLEMHGDRHRRRLIVTDSVFSMDGDVCPLPRLLDLAAEFDAMTLVDEAHATGVLGPTGAGAVEALGCTGRPLVQVGTLSKALGSLGGYVAGSRSLIDYLRNRASTWIYTTGLSPADTAAAIAALDLVRTEPERRTHLHAHADYLRTGLTEAIAAFDLPPSYHRLPSESPIICVTVPDPATVLRIGSALREGGILAGAIRPPTVPTSRIRFTVRADHTREQCDRAIALLREAIAPRVGQT